MDKTEKKMDCQREILLGYDAFPLAPFETEGQQLEFLSLKLNPQGRLLLALIQYLQQHTNYFDKTNFVVTHEKPGIWHNGTWGGLVRKINASEIDVGVSLVFMTEDLLKKVDFSFPYQLHDYTFVTQKPKYKPQIFGIFKTFSLPVWMSIMSVLFVMPIISFVILKRKYTFNDICFHVFAILLRQNSIIRPSSLVEKLFVYSWVVGAMILCLSHDSVFLSFLSIPPVTKIKTLLDLSLAIQSDDYICIDDPYSSIAGDWMISKEEHLRTIAKNIVENLPSYRGQEPLTYFLQESHKQNLAFIIDTRYAGTLDPGTISISEERFLEGMPAMMVRKNFCYKDLLDSFVHKIVASGLYIKYNSDNSFFSSMLVRSQIPDYEKPSNRKLTITDVAPAFIFLLSGYFISFLVLIVEIYLYRNKKKSMKIKKKRKRTHVYNEIPV